MGFQRRLSSAVVDETAHQLSFGWAARSRFLTWLTMPSCLYRIDSATRVKAGS